MFFFLSFCSLGYFKKIDLWAARRENKFLAETNVTSALKHFFEWFPYSSLYTWQYANQLKPVCIWLRALSKSLRSPLLSGMSPWQKTEFATSPTAPSTTSILTSQACRPNRPVSGQVRRLRWMTPGKLLPDKNRVEKGGGGKWSRRVEEEDAGWGRRLLLRCAA